VCARTFVWVCFFFFLLLLLPQEKLMNLFAFSVLLGFTARMLRMPR
jgi:hypothetical protein